jgi:hypothetical protein
MFNPYTKALLGAVLVLLGTIANAMEDGTGLSTSEIVTAVVVTLGALGSIWAAHITIKWLVGGVVAFLGALATAMEDGTGVSAQEWVTMSVAAVTALVAVYATANTFASNSPAVEVTKTPIQPT